MSSGGGDQTTTSTAVQPYSAAEPGLNQILSEAGTIYGQGPAGAGYVAPTTQTLTGNTSIELLTVPLILEASDSIKATISSTDSIHFGISYMSVT